MHVIVKKKITNARKCVLIYKKKTFSIIKIWLQRMQKYTCTYMVLKLTKCYQTNPHQHVHFQFLVRKECINMIFKIRHLSYH
jgi:hypothetical protein